MPVQGLDPTGLLEWDSIVLQFTFCADEVARPDRVILALVLTVLYLARGRPSSSNVCNTNDKGQFYSGVEKSTYANLQRLSKTRLLNVMADVPGVRR
jgi:hypothetical protein